MIFTNFPNWEGCLTKKKIEIFLFKEAQTKHGPCLCGFQNVSRKEMESIGAVSSKTGSTLCIPAECTLLGTKSRHILVCVSGRDPHSVVHSALEFSTSSWPPTFNDPPASGCQVLNHGFEPPLVALLCLKLKTRLLSSDHDHCWRQRWSLVTYLVIEDLQRSLAVRRSPSKQQN